MLGEVVRLVSVFTAARNSKRPWQLVLANRCPVCNLPKHLHDRDPDGDIRVRVDVALPKPRIDYPDRCMPNPFAARKIVSDAGGAADYSRGAFVRRLAPWP